MTGYGTGQSTHGGVLVKVELRSVNHRFLDASIRIPREFQGLEPRVKDALAARMSRGRLSATIEVAQEANGARVVVDEALAAEYRDVLRRLQDAHDLPAEIDAVAFAQLPDLLRREATPPEEGAVTAALDVALGDAIGQVAAMREREGRALQEDLAARVAHVRELLDAVNAAGSGAAEKLLEKLRGRIARLLPDGAPVDADRLAQEVATIAERADIAEELVRFRAHADAFAAFLDRDEPVGKRLDFLLQEMNREGNTIGSKSQDARIAHLVVELKEEIERLREQVQNIE